MFTTLAKNEVSQLIDGPVGKLEVVVAEVSKEANARWGIVCHPHPLYGGSMHNKVVTTLVRAYQELGLNTIRFNFRGVGKSEGVYANGEGELDDLIAIIHWLNQEATARHPNLPSPEIWLAGFSFGAYIAAKAATQIATSKLLTVAPPVLNFPMADLPPITCPWWLVQGEKDEVVSPEAVIAWAKSRDPQPAILLFPEATHFFHGLLGELRVRVIGALTEK